MSFTAGTALSRGGGADGAPPMTRGETDEARRLEGKACGVAGEVGVLWGSEEGVGSNKGQEQGAGAVEGMVERIVVAEAGDRRLDEGAEAVEEDDDNSGAVDGDHGSSSWMAL